MTPELWQFCLRLFALDEELQVFGRLPRGTTRLERDGVKLVRRERALVERMEIEAMQRKRR